MMNWFDGMMTSLSMQVVRSAEAKTGDTAEAAVVCVGGAVGAVTGIAVGSAFGPLGALIGMYVGATVGTEGTQVAIRRLIDFLGGS